MSRVFVMGDPHGALKAIKQVLWSSKFDFDNDKLIVLGDVSDGWPDVAESFEFLINEVKNLVYVRGNHDQWIKEFLEFGKQPLIWTMQGGRNSWLSYMKNPELMKKHLAFLKKTPCYYLDEKNRVFVHGGIDLKKKIEDNEKMYLMWDRDLWDMRNNSDLKRRGLMQYKEIYVGHTSIYRFSHKPIKYGNVWFMDTGAGWEGVLSLMDIDSKEIWQSDVVADLYPNSRGRNDV